MEDGRRPTVGRPRSINVPPLNLPQDFIATIQNTFGDEGRAFLHALPGLVTEASRRWDLSEVQAVSNLSYNFVAWAKRGDEEVVLKIGVPNRELTSEMAALRLFNGQGAVRLLEADEARGMCVLERLRPGEMLSTLKDDDQSTHIAAEVMLRLWKPAPMDDAFIRLSDWFKGLDRLRPAFSGGTGPFPKKLIEEVEETLPRLFADSTSPMLIHGDLHHFNILSSAPGWLAIDPKGVIGPPEYEVGPLLINPMPGFLNGSRPEVRMERRIAILSERLGFSRQSIRDWGLCHAVLSAWWDMSPEGKGGEYSIRCAEVLSKAQL
jgi:streptomycin 6-kinase